MSPEKFVAFAEQLEDEQSDLYISVTRPVCTLVDGGFEYAYPEINNESIASILSTFLSTLQDVALSGDATPRERLLWATGKKYWGHYHSDRDFHASAVAIATNHAIAQREAHQLASAAEAG